MMTPPPNWLPIVVVLHRNSPVSQKSQNTTKLFLRRIFRRSTKLYTIQNIENNTLFKDVEIFYTTLLTATGIWMLHMYSQTAV